VTDRIAKVETFLLRLPMGGTVNFASAKDTHAPYVVLRLTTKDGAVGLAETIARPQQFQGEDIAGIAHQIDSFFKPTLEGADPLEHNRILAEMAKVKGCRAAKAMVDVALWDLKGKLLDQPVWRLLGCGEPKPVPVTSIVFGDSPKEMVKFAETVVTKHKVRGLKIKVWKRSMADVEMVRDIRKAVGDGVFLYADANGVYKESEVRLYLSKLADYGIAMLEDPCKVGSMDRMAALARDLPFAILGDLAAESAEAVHAMIKADALGAVSVKLRRTGITESLKLIGICEAAGLSMVIGTDTESRLGVLARLHLRAAIPAFEPLPAEVGFFEQLAGDAFDGQLSIKDGFVTVPTGPGFGTAIDQKRLEKYRVTV
jgi:L-alanine-DL-glutamate epimerase-like enolase superfamily enzyme